MSDHVLLVIPVILPLLAAALVMTVRRSPRASEYVTTGAMLVGLAASAILLGRATDGGVLALTVFGGWPVGTGISFAARLPGAVLVTVTMVIAVAVSIYNHAAIGERRRQSGHDVLLLAMTGAVNGAFLTNDLFNLYVWFELALLSALGLIMIDRRERQIGAGLRYAAFGIIGATAILAGIGLLYGTVGSLDLDVLAARLGEGRPNAATAIAAALFLGGFALKSGLFPFHLWLPAAYAPAPVSVMAIFAGLLTKMGFYALLIVLGGIFGAGFGRGAASMLPVLTFIAGATMLVCSIAALSQNDMRRLLAYHVVAQVGYMMAGLATGTQDGVESAVFYMIHSMIVQTNLVLGAGAINRATGSWDLTSTGGMLRHNPVFCFLFAVPMLSLAGIPPLSGFWAKVLVFRELIDTGQFLLLAAGLVAALLTIFSVAIFWSAACWKDLRGRDPRPVPLAMLMGMGVLSTATLSIGLMPGWIDRLAKLSAAAIGRMGIFA